MYVYSIYYTFIAYKSCEQVVDITTGWMSFSTAAQGWEKTSHTNVIKIACRAAHEGAATCTLCTQCIVSIHFVVGVPLLLRAIAPGSHRGVILSTKNTPQQKIQT